MMGPVKSHLNDTGTSITAFEITPAAIAELIALVDSGKINNTVAAQKLFPALLKNKNKAPGPLAEEMNLIISAEKDDLSEFIQAALAKYPDKVIEYRKGKKGVIGLFMGEIMKVSKGRIDPQKTNLLLIKELESK